jgi:hypothetical protein
VREKPLHSVARRRATTNEPIGAPLSTRRRRGWRRDLGAPRIGARVGTLMESVFFALSP